MIINPHMLIKKLLICLEFVLEYSFEKYCGSCFSRLTIAIQLYDRYLFTFTEDHIKQMIMAHF